MALREEWKFEYSAKDLAAAADLKNLTMNNGCNGGKTSKRK